MKKIFLMSFALIVAFQVQSQYHADFENPNLGLETAWYGQDQVIDGDTIYTNGNFNFENNYNSGWGSFVGWGISNITDNTTPGIANQYSAITGEGYASSLQYAFCYAVPWDDHRVFNTLTETMTIPGFYITNTTYAYFAMLNGDSFTKPFGADTNAQGVIDGTNGEDWFLLTVYGLDEDSLYTGDSVNFYLADFRFSNDVEDYIIDEWTYVDLTSLGAVKGLDFVMSSSDTSGGMGMNNPSYFAMDDLFGSYATVYENESAELNIYPNPTAGMVNMQLPLNSNVLIHDSNGKLVHEFVTDAKFVELDLSGFENGIYFITAVSDGAVLNQKIIKN